MHSDKLPKGKMDEVDTLGEVGFGGGKSKLCFIIRLTNYFNFIFRCISWHEKVLKNFQKSP